MKLTVHQSKEAVSGVRISDEPRMKQAHLIWKLQRRPWVKDGEEPHIPAAGHHRDAPGKQPAGRASLFLRVIAHRSPRRGLRPPIPSVNPINPVPRQQPTRRLGTALLRRRLHSNSRCLLQRASPLLLRGSLIAREEFLLCGDKVIGEEVAYDQMTPYRPSRVYQVLRWVAGG